MLNFLGLSGAALYDKLDSPRKAGFLNILCKSAATAFADKRSVASYVDRLTELRGDRSFAVVPHELREETKNSVASGLFDPVPDTLHHPPDGFSHAGSFKTRDHYGNLQPMFFSSGTNWLADIDIDEANGIEHVFQVLGSLITQSTTNPYDIHELLIEHQKLEPGYRLMV